MKLLSRKTVSNEVAEQRRQAIEEGILIARRVDTLRQTLSSLEKQQTDFLNGMEGNLKKKTETLLNEIALRKLEIVQLDEKRRKLLEPPTAEFDAIRMGRAENEKTKQILARGLEKIALRDTQTRDKYEETKRNLAKVNVRERELIKIYEKAEQNVKETEKIKENALAEMARIDRYITEKTQEILNEELKVKQKERELEISAQKIVDDTAYLAVKELQLKDRIDIFERTLKRNVKR